MTKNKSIGKHALENIKYKNNLNVLKHTKIKGKSKNEKHHNVLSSSLFYSIKYQRIMSISMYL